MRDRVFRDLDRNGAYSNDRMSERLHSPAEQGNEHRTEASQEFSNTKTSTYKPSSLTWTRVPFARSFVESDSLCSVVPSLRSGQNIKMHKEFLPDFTRRCEEERRRGL